MPPTVLAASHTQSPASIVGAVVSLVILALILVRQRQVRVLRTRLVLPLALVLLGIASLTSATRNHPLSLGQIAVLAGLLAGDAVGIGIARAYTVRLWRDDGVIFRQGGWLTVLLWLASVAIHGGVLIIAHTDASSLLLYLGITVAAQRLALDARARHPHRLGHAPRPTAYGPTRRHRHPNRSRTPSD